MRLRARRKDNGLYIYFDIGQLCAAHEAFTPYVLDDDERVFIDIKSIKDVTGMTDIDEFKEYMSDGYVENFTGILKDEL